ncbi:MAG: hypothetical protein IPN92_00625 [Chromatiaceae bacterium]|nr:hypothetical protein [Chromatiaceae bacterium]
MSVAGTPSREPSIWQCSRCLRQCPWLSRDYDWVATARWWMSMGLINCGPVHPREVFAHNHPSGGVEPSQSDMGITAQLKAAGEVAGIELLDHIIFNRTGYFSFLENGIL